MLFPFKFKLEMNLLPEPLPISIGFAGGFMLGNGSDPVLSAYIQVHSGGNCNTFYMGVTTICRYTLILLSQTTQAFTLLWEISISEGSYISFLE